MLLLVLSSCVQASDVNSVSSVADLISAALSYTSTSTSSTAAAGSSSASSSSGPGTQAPPPLAQHGIKFANDTTKSFASVPPPDGQIHSSPSPPTPPLPPCSSFLQGQQLSELTGQWVDHPNASWMGYYDMTADCPGFVHDYDCRHPPPSEHVDPALIQQEYRKVLQPDECALAPFDAGALAARLGGNGGRRLIMLGDSLMRLHFYSMACLLRKQISWGKASVWENSDIR